MLQQHGQFLQLFNLEIKAKARAQIDPEFEVAYQTTEGTNLNSFIESYTNKLNSETEWVLTWLDILLTHAHEQTDVTN